MEQLQSHKWNAKTFPHIYMRRPLVIYDFATAPLWTFLYMRKIRFSFLSVYVREEGLAWFHPVGKDKYNTVVHQLSFYWMMYDRLQVAVAPARSSCCSYYSSSFNSTDAGGPPNKRLREWVRKRREASNTVISSKKQLWPRHILLWQLRKIRISSS